jgi:hypothetical protein
MMLRLRALVAALSLTAAVGGSLLVAGTAHAQPVTTGTLSFSGDSGDYISGGKSYSYSTGGGDALKVSSANGSTLSVSVNAYNGDWWTLELDAPGTPDEPVPGQSPILVPGTYAAAHRYPFNGTGPGLSLSGNGRGCNTLTGSFTVTKAVFGAGGYVQNFDATFEQHCEGGSTAARGEVHISNAPAPPATSAVAPSPTTTRATTVTTQPRTTNTPAGAQPGITGTPAGAQPSISGTPPATHNESSTLAGTVRAPLLLLGVGVIGWFVFMVFGLVTVGVVIAARRR